MRIILGSQSTGRKSVLERLGYEFDVMTADIDEKAIRSDDPEDLTLQLAHAKADAILLRITGPALLITSDQVVAWEDKVLEKPESRDQARAYFEGYQSQPPETVTAVVVTNTETGKRSEGVDRAKVIFAPMPSDVIEQLIADGDTYTRAGGFSVEDPRLQDYVKAMQGEVESIIGLPRTLTERLLKEAQGM